VPGQEHIDFSHGLGGRQAPQFAVEDILANQVFGQEAQPDAGHHHAPHLFDIGRRAHDSAREALLVTEDGQRGQRVADLITGEAHEVLVHQVFDADPLFREQRMVPAADHRVMVPQEQAPLQGIDGLAAQADAQRRHPLGKRVQDGRAGQHVHVEFDPGIAAMELRQEVVVCRALHLAHHQQPQRAGDLCLVLGGGVLDARHRAVHVAGDRVDLVAQARQTEFAVAPMQQQAAHRLFQPLERLADGWLAQMQRLRRPAHPALLHHEHEGAQQVPVHAFGRKRQRGGRRSRFSGGRLGHGIAEGIEKKAVEPRWPCRRRALQTPDSPAKNRDALDSNPSI